MSEDTQNSWLDEQIREEVARSQTLIKAIREAREILRYAPYPEYKAVVLAAEADDVLSKALDAIGAKP